MGSRLTAQDEPARASARLARIVALAIIIGIGVNHVWWSVTDWHLDDMDAYWQAGLRLREARRSIHRLTTCWPPRSTATARGSPGCGSR